MPQVSKAAVENMKNLTDASSHVTLRNLIYLKEQVEIKEIVKAL